MNQFYNNVTQKGRYKKKILLDMSIISRYVTHFLSRIYIKMFHSINTKMDGWLDGVMTQNKDSISECGLL